MTDLVHILPEFPVQQYSHLLPSLEKNLVTTCDLLLLDAVDVARRCQLPVLDIQNFRVRVTTLIEQQLGLEAARVSQNDTDDSVDSYRGHYGQHYVSGSVLSRPSSFISTLDDGLDAALGGGIPAGYLTEVTGERYCSGLVLRDDLFTTSLVVRVKHSYF